MPDPNSTGVKPIRWQDYESHLTVDLVTRVDTLSLRDAAGRGIAQLIEAGTYDPALHADPAENPLLTVPEHLKLIAIAEAIARKIRHPTHVHHAVMAGATWEQIAMARGIESAEARAEYRTWADHQHRLYADYRIGLDDSAYAAACEAAERTEA